MALLGPSCGLISLGPNAMPRFSSKRIIRSELREAGDQSAHKNLQQEASNSLQSCKYVTRRETIALSIGSIAVAELGDVCAALATDSNPGRALILTGNERDRKRSATNAMESLRSRVSTFRLANGMKWVVLQRHNAPIIACHTYADIGALNEPLGLTGIAHLLEHLAFKGTKLVGTKDWIKEGALLDQLDEIFYALTEAKKEGNITETQRLSTIFRELQAEAGKFSVANEYGAILSRQGGVGLNAQTSHDSTEYFVSLPQNKLELWMALESGRFIEPVFRDLYSEKEVVKEERRLRVDNSPYGKFTQEFAEIAFTDLPYGRPVIGYPDDFEGIGRREVQAFFEKNYTPCNLTCAIVGDVDPHDVERMATKYFGGWSVPCDHDSADNTLRLWKSANGWDGIDKVPKVLRRKVSAQPLFMEGYYRPAYWSKDDHVISVVDQLLSAGRLSRFYANLVSTGKALTVSSSESYPGDKEPCMFLVYGAPPPGKSIDWLANDVHSQLEYLATRKVGDEELQPIKKASRASLLAILGSNEGMAKLLSRYEATTPSWSCLLDEVNEVDSVSSDDVLRVASLLFRPVNRVAGFAESMELLQ